MNEKTYAEHRRKTAEILHESKVRREHIEAGKEAYRRSRVKDQVRALLPLQVATFDARERTGEKIATKVSKGKWAVTRLTILEDGSSDEENLSGWIEGSEVVPFLDSLPAKK